MYLYSTICLMVSAQKMADAGEEPNHTAIDLEGRM